MEGEFCSALLKWARDVKKLETVCTILWRLWNNRNSTFHENKYLLQVPIGIGSTLIM